MRLYFLFLVLLYLVSCKSNQAVTESSPDHRQDTSAVQDLVHLEGFFDLYWDNKKGKVLMKIDKLDQEFLYVNSLVTGIGSNDIGLDRGQFGDNRVVKFVVTGSRILLLQPNYDFRAESDNPAEIKAVREAFATSVLWGFPIRESMPDGYLVDATDFFMQDVHNVAGRLKDMGQGNYGLNSSRSALFRKGLKNFPLNTEIEAVLTFTGEPEGGYIHEVAPTPGSITVRQRHSFVQLPDDQFEKRPFDPRAGYLHISYKDYATSFDQSLVKRFIVKHRLKKKYPDSLVSEPVESIVYYLDPGVPEPVRSALLEGAGWWNAAFEAAGYHNAFRIEMLPEDADIMDIRYNVIQWVHRSSRGWSYGRSVIDPRTGEIIKGHVSLGSLRVRQDFLMAQGLLSPYYDGEEDIQEAREMALARIRQLSAHEVGHTLGLAHNFAASANDRASVMDYPHPLINLNEEGKIDLSQAYDTGIGEWDKMAIRYGYTDLPSGKNESGVLDAIIRDAIDKGLYFISDRDARSAGSAHPHAHLWDNNVNPADELFRIIEVRKTALADFGVYSIPEGMPYSSLENVLVPIYLLHRYQAEATSKLVGGIHYTYAIRGDNQVITAPVPPETQQMAIEALLETISPAFLMIPENILNLIPPEALGYYETRENFKSKTGITFDPLSAAESAADMTLKLLLHPERASRLIELHSRDSRQPDMSDIIGKLINITWKTNPQDTYLAEINRAVSKLVLANLLELAVNEEATGQARAKVLMKIYELEEWLNVRIKRSGGDQKAHYLFGIKLISQFREDPDAFKTVEPKELPPGSPIGTIQLKCDF